MSVIVSAISLVYAVGCYQKGNSRTTILLIFACGALAASISVGIVIPSTWFVYLYKQTVSITVVVLSTVIKTGTTAQIE